MTAAECVELARAAGVSFQGPINAFIDAFARASPEQRARMIREPIAPLGRIEGLLAAVVSALCRRAGLAAPAWVGQTRSPEPFFAFPARSYALRVRLMLESPPPFRSRNVFVPESYLERA
jgi:hypothetical protein